MNIETVKSWRPCSDGLVWLNSQPDLDTAWQSCQRADWLLWGLRQGDILDKTTGIRIAVACAEHVLPVFERAYPQDTRPRVAILAAKAWLKKPTKANRRAAAHAAHAAADATHATAYAAAYAAVLKIKILRYGVKLLEAQGEEGKAEERAKYAKVVEAAAKVLDLIECTACGDFKNPGCNAKNKHRSCPKNTLKSALAKLEEKSNLNLVPVEGEVKDGK